MNHPYALPLIRLTFYVSSFMNDEDGLFEQPAGRHQAPGEAVSVVIASRDW